MIRNREKKTTAGQERVWGVCTSGAGVKKTKKQTIFRRITIHPTLEMINAAMGVHFLRKILSSSGAPAYSTPAKEYGSGIPICKLIRDIPSTME